MNVQWPVKSFVLSLGLVVGLTGYIYDPHYSGPVHLYLIYTSTKGHSGSK